MHSRVSTPVYTETRIVQFAKSSEIIINNNELLINASPSAQLVCWVAHDDGARRPHSSQGRRRRWKKAREVTINRPKSIYHNAWSKLLLRCHDDNTKRQSGIRKECCDCCLLGNTPTPFRKPFRGSRKKVSPVRLIMINQLSLSGVGSGAITLFSAHFGHWARIS